MQTVNPPLLRAFAASSRFCAALLVLPLFGETKTLLRAPRLRSEGWC